MPFASPRNVARSSVGLAVAGLVLLLTGCGSGSALFERQTLTIELRDPVVGTSKTDVWAMTPSGGADVLTHSPDLKRWSAISLAEAGATVEPRVVGVVSAGKDAAWVLTSNASSVTQLWRVSARGSVEDHSSELPTGTDTLGGLAGNEQALFLTGTAPSGSTQTARLYRRTSGNFELVPNLPAAIELTVLGVHGAEDFYLWHNPEGFGQPSKVLHVASGVATDVGWKADTAPELTLSATGEVWMWKRSGTSDGGNGLYSDGSSTFTEWTSKGWPVQSSEEPVTHYGFATVPLGPGRLAMLTHSTDFSATVTSERDSLRVMFLDPQGQVTEGGLLAGCLTLEQCAAGRIWRLDDGTILVPGSDPTTILVGSTEALK